MKLTPLYYQHLELGAEMFTTRAGYSMPAKYRTVAEEHAAVRERVGLSDLSLMGRLDIQGPDALALLQRLVVADAARLADGQLLYTTMCDEQGLIRDDITLWRFGPEHFRVVTSSVFRPKSQAWLEAHAQGRAAYITDVSSSLGLIPVQGPRSRDLLQGLADFDLASLKFFRFTSGHLGGVPALIARVGFSGELGYECYFSTEDTVAAWQALMKAGEPYGLLPYGFDVLDTLRWEKGFVFFGYDATEQNNPYECGLWKWIRYDKGDFIGREALLKIKETGPARLLVGLQVAGEKTAPAGAPLRRDGQAVGEIVAGFFGPTVRRNLAYAFIASAHAQPGTPFTLEIDGVETAATVAEMPFYDPAGERMRM